MRHLLFPIIGLLIVSTACTKADVGVCDVAPEGFEVALNTPLTTQQREFFTKNYRTCKTRKLKKDPNALYNVGVAVLQGLGTEKDASKAFLWFKGAADKNHRGAQAILAEMFMQGVGVVRDPLIAQKYLEVVRHPPQGG
jgi:hypothetical protein